VADPEVADSEVADPEVAEPEVADSEVADPEVSDPDVAEVEAAEVEAAEVEAAEDEAAEDEAAELDAVVAVEADVKVDIAPDVLFGHKDGRVPLIATLKYPQLQEGSLVPTRKTCIVRSALVLGAVHSRSRVVDLGKLSSWVKQLPAPLETT